ncbi:zinc ribbon domain-containing protein [Modicisalibacter xianhensis]|uniref:Zinc ribbon domain-containing protein n=1 Tax=Modicisalibacter xianhensis TaxID=442341 RepID=A0A1I3GQL8_9GAMM|nr:zinc ribbon domain-containing protein [Halomonas xianhensis]SFI25684.1 hypothetical protein SAMN04487959_1391 [Halomonas xianhensis]
MIDDTVNQGYEQRADYIENSEIVKWNAQNKLQENIQDKLLQRGAKVLIGPRGAGKTHNMKMAHIACQKDNAKPFSVYVSFARYLRVEQFKIKASNAISIFHSWVLSRILEGIHESLEYSGLSLSDVGVEIDLSILRKYRSDIEKGDFKEEYNDLIDNINIDLVSGALEKAYTACGRKRCIVLCDDAALVLARDFMVEFFDIFRSLKSSRVSPKASAYPLTDFGPRFHLNHDAEPVECWIGVEHPSYEDFFKKIFEKRFVENQFDEYVSAFSYAAFGIPRTFISLVLEFYQDVESSRSKQSLFNKIIKDRSEFIKAEYSSLSSKMPHYKKFVEAGAELSDKIVELVAEENKKAYTDNGEKQIYVGIEFGDCAPAEEKIISLLKETGLVYENAAVSHGKGRIYRRFMPHICLLIDAKAFQIGKGSSVKNITEIFQAGNVKHPVRRRFSSLLEREVGDITIDLPGCPVCGTERVMENQRFCMSCGAELKSISLYKELLSLPIDKLPFTKWQKTKIKEETDFKTAGDIAISDNVAGVIRKIKGFGPARTHFVIESVKEPLNNSVLFS